MLSVNQLNAQIKLTEAWKALNKENFRVINIENQISRSMTNGRLVEIAVSNGLQCTFIHDSKKIWNNAPSQLKTCSSLYLVKKGDNFFVKTLPL